MTRASHSWSSIRIADNILAIEEATVEQSKSDLWKEVWKVRISASSDKSIPMKEETDPDNFLYSKLYPTFFGTEATATGFALESLVLEKLSKIQKLQKTGVLISKTLKWLCASPDGLTDEMLIVSKMPLPCDPTRIH